MGEPLTPYTAEWMWIEQLRGWHDPVKGCSWSCAAKTNGEPCETARWLATLDAARAAAPAGETAVDTDMEGDGWCAQCGRRHGGPCPPAPDPVAGLREALDAAQHVLSNLDTSLDHSTVDWAEVRTALKVVNRALLDSGEQETRDAAVRERDELRAALDDLRRLIVSYADLTHDVVRDPNGDWRDIAAEWGKVVDAARAALHPETTETGS